MSANNDADCCDGCGCSQEVYCWKCSMQFNWWALIVGSIVGFIPFMWVILAMASHPAYVKIMVGLVVWCVTILCIIFLVMLLTIDFSNGGKPMPVGAAIQKIVARPSVFGNGESFQEKWTSTLERVHTRDSDLPRGLLPDHWSCVERVADQERPVSPPQFRLRSASSTLAGALVDEKPSMPLQEMVSVPALKELAQQLMDATWKNVTTRDREYDQVKRFKVVDVMRNENVDLWCAYWHRRDRLRQLYSDAGSGEVVGQPSFPRFSLGELQTRSAAEWASRSRAFEYSDAEPPLFSECNEVFLFHGTSVSAANAICKEGFDFSHVGRRSGGALYGPALYFAENSSKADEYAKLEGQLRAVLLCRVTLGNVCLCEEDLPDLTRLMRNLREDRHHSILGDRAKIRSTYREFAIFDRFQAFPEYLICYERIA